MKKTNRILAIILAILMVISNIPITASAAAPTSGTCGDNLTWEYDSATYTLTISGTGDMYDYDSDNRPWESYEDSIKVVVFEEGITSIGTYAFYHCGKLVEATFPDDITSIGEFAFGSCSKLEMVTLPNGLNIIEQGLFSRCSSLQYINIPDSVTIISDSAFRFCSSIENVTIPEGVTTIGEYAFSKCSSLASVTIPKSITSIGMWAFSFCENLTNVIFPDNLKEIPYAMFIYCTNLTSITIPDSVTRIGISAFYDTAYYNNKSNWEDEVLYLDDCLIEANSSISGTYEIKDGTRLIADEAFDYCDDLVSIIIPETVNTIGRSVFSNCDALSNITVDSNNPYFSNDDYGVLFNKDKTTLIHYPSGSTQTSYVIPDGVNTICRVAFYYSPACLESIVIPESLTMLETVAFRDYKYDLILYYKGTQTQWDELLANNSETSDYLKNYTVICTDNTTYPSGVCGDNLTWLFNAETNTLTISGTGAMYDYEINDVSGFINQPWSDFSRNIKHIVVEDGVTSIGEAAFASCDFTDIIIGDSVASIGSEAIKYCDCLTEIIVDEDNQYYSNDEFGVLFNKDKTTLIHYPIGNQRENYTIPDGVKVIGTYAFDKCNKTLLKVTIPKSVTTIEKFAFNVTGFLAYYKVDYVGTQSEWNLVSVDGTNDIAVTYLEQEHQHEYETVVNAPTCTEQGYTTYTCECSDSYVADYVNALGHSYINGICDVCGVFTGIKDDYFYKDDVKQKAYQLVEFEGDYYFINDGHKIAKNTVLYLGDRFVNGFTFADGTPIPPGLYRFDEDGKMIIRNGVVGDYFYKNNVRQNAYQLVELEGDFYFINDSHKIAKNKTLYLSDRFVNGFTYEDGTPLQPGYYTFDENGKMVILNGPVGDYFYENNVRLKAYQLVEYEGNYYFINDSHKLANNMRLYLSQRFIEGTDLAVGWYEFDADGKMIIS